VAIWERAEGRFEAVVELPLDSPDVLSERLTTARDLGLPIL
jgi:hypothetical protein